jgi:hypothetical protein
LVLGSEECGKDGELLFQYNLFTALKEVRDSGLHPLGLGFIYNVLSSDTEMGLFVW